MSVQHWDEIGPESEWVEGLAPEDVPEPPEREPEAAEPPPQEHDFHSEMKTLMAKHGLDDFFYVVRSADGKTCGMNWAISALPAAEGYRARCAGLAFEASGLLQHMEGSTWPQQG